MHSLFLHCENPLWRPDSAGEVARLLGGMGLTGAAQADDALLFDAGEQFLALVMFLGCSPQVSLDAQAAADGQPVCRVRLHEAPAVRLLASRPAPALRCPACRAPQSCPDPVAYDRVLTCAACAESFPLHRLDWRRGAGFGCFFVEIENIFPHEAVPADGLMSGLEAFSGARWQYFYLSR